MSVALAPIPVASPTALDTLVGTYLIRETPEVYWEDAHGLFRFDSEEEARAALGDLYYQLFLPHVNWAETIVREVRRYRRYSCDQAEVWTVVCATVGARGPLRMSVQHGLWQCCFGEHPGAESRFPAVSICLAALRAHGLTIEADLDRIEAELNRRGAVVGGADGVQERFDVRGVFGASPAL